MVKLPRYMNFFFFVSLTTLYLSSFSAKYSWKKHSESVNCPTGCGNAASTPTVVVTCEEYLNGSDDGNTVTDDKCWFTKPSATKKCHKTWDCRNLFFFFFLNYTHWFSKG